MGGFYEEDPTCKCCRGGAVAIEAAGRLTVDTTTASARGANGSLGQSGRNGQGAFTPLPGRTVSDPAGDGGDGGRGGRGGAGGSGGQGGGGGGGTIGLTGSIVSFTGDNSVNAAGGNRASAGRFVLKSNATSGSATSVNANTQTFAGPQATNNLILGDVFTPFLPDLEGGVAVSGILSGFGADDRFFASLFQGAGQNDVAAIARTSLTDLVFGALFDGFDLLVLANLSTETLSDVRLGVDPGSTGTGFLQDLGLNSGLTGMAVFATLIPKDGTTFSVSANGSSLLNIVLENDVAQFLERSSVSEIPLPAPILLLLSALAGLGILKLRKRSNASA